MKIFLHHKDILEVSEADTLVLPVDGAGPRMEGRIARHFMEHVGVFDMDDVYVGAPDYPFNGKCHWSDIEGDFDNTHFKYICALGVLSHAPGAEHMSFLRAALTEMFQSGEREWGKKLACPVLSSGWRLKPVDALHAMLDEVDRFSRSPLELHIAELDPARYLMFREIVG